MDSIIKDIKEAHKRDSTAAKEIRQAIMEAYSFTESAQEEMKMISFKFCSNVEFDNKCNKQEFVELF